MKHLLKPIILIASVLLLFSCEFELDSNEDQSSVFETDSTMFSSSKIGPRGGIFEFHNNIQLEVPQGSLEKEINIKITSVKDTSQSNKEILLLEPEGTIFKKPVIITVPYEKIATGLDGVLQAYSCNDGIWEEQKIIYVDNANKLVQIEISHFSLLLLNNRGELFLTVDIPSKYLLKGDLLYALSYWSIGNINVTDFNWFPGHVGLFLGKGAIPADLTKDIIESTPNWVQTSSLSSFTEASYHLFMGARRYQGSIGSYNREKIAEFANKQLGKPYSKVGQQPTSNSFSCVGLTEAAYEYAGLNIIPSKWEIFYSLPYDQYYMTKPVDYIEIKSGEEITLKIFGVIWDEEQHYIKNLDGVNVLNPPANSTLTKSSDSWIFKWIPGENDINKNFKVTFRIQKAIQGGVIQQSQTITLHIASNNPSDLKISTLVSNLEFPGAIFLSNKKLYFTETAAMSSTYGGKLTLKEYDLLTDQVKLLKDHPMNAHSMVVIGRKIYLSSWKSRIPGESGSVSVYDLDTNTESPLCQIEIATEDMCLDSQNNFYVLGSSDLQNAKSMYKFPISDYTKPSVILSGLGRTWSIASKDNSLFYSDHYNIYKVDPSNYKTIFYSKSNVMGMAISENYLYYSDYFAGKIGRINLFTKEEEVLVENIIHPNKMVLDKSLNILYVLTCGTSVNQYKDGSIMKIENAL